MGRDFTTSSASRQDSGSNLLPEASWHLGAVSLLDAGKLMIAMAIGALLIALAYQIPVTHTVDIGGYDAAYTQGFYDPERDTPAAPRPELLGSDGSARWTRDSSYLVFPQAGLPAQLTLRLRGWRTSGTPPEVTLLLNGTQPLGSFRAGSDWQDHTFAINSGLLKPNDVVIEIRSETAQLDSGDPRAVGVLLDRATFHAGPAPIMPYPPQLLYGALAAGMLYVLLGKNREQRIENTRSFMLRAVLGAFVLCLLFFVLYRSQPLYPYPLLRLLPVIDGVLAALLAVRYGPRLAWDAPALLDALAVGGVGVWLAAVLVSAQQHVTLSLPSVEGDFRVFALRSAHLVGQFPAGTTSPDADGILRADGFYNLGYPLLLWLARPLSSDNAFLAGRLVAALSGALLLLACWWLARRLLGRGGALLALLVLALSPLVVEYSLYVGTDMPFAAACALALALLIADCRLQIADYEHKPSAMPSGHSKLQFAMLVAAGIAAGMAFLIRHPGLLLLPFGYLCIWLQRDRAAETRKQHIWQRFKFSIFNFQFSIFLLAFLITISPQIVVNMRDTGQPFYSQQAKNIWQGVFGDGDWGRWAATANDITLGRVLAQDPPRFLANWWANVRGYFGTGGEDTREFGQATQLRLLGFPTNWLAIAGLLGWLALSFWRWRRRGQKTGRPGEEEKVSLSPCLLVSWSPLLVWLALYVLTVSVGLAPQARFFLPLAPIYALAAAWVVVQLRSAPNDSLAAHPQHGIRNMRYQIIAGITLLVLLWGNFATGAAYVTRTRLSFGDTMPGQPPDEVAAASLVQNTLRDNDRLVLQPPPDSIDGIALGKYSAIADRVVPAPPTDDLVALRATGAGFLLRATLLGPAPGNLAVVASAGGYTLYIIQ